MCNYYKSLLNEEDKNSFHMTTDEMFAMIFEYMASGYEDKIDPNARWAETKAEKSRLKDFNAINEMFIK